MRLPKSFLGVTNWEIDHTERAPGDLDLPPRLPGSPAESPETSRVRTVLTWADSLGLLLLSRISIIFPKRIVHNDIERPRVYV